MSLFDFLKGLAFTAPCCKEDLPEVERVIDTLDPLLASWWAQKIRDAAIYTEAQIGLYSDRLGRDSVDVLVEGGNLDDQVAALLATLEERMGCPLSTEDSLAVEQEAEELLLGGATALGIAFAAGGPREALQARRALYLHISERVTAARRSTLLGVLREPLTNRELRTALRATTKTAAQALLVEAWRTRLGAPLGAEWSTWGPQTVDAWAYWTHNTGRFLAGEKAGVKRWRAKAVIDSRTSSLCRWLNGRIVPTYRIRKQLKEVQAAIDAGDLSRIRLVRPLSPPTNPAGFPAYFKLLGIPAYHFRCRTVLVPA